MARGTTFFEGSLSVKISLSRIPPLPINQPSRLCVRDFVLSESSKRTSACPFGQIHSRERCAHHFTSLCSQKQASISFSSPLVPDDPEDPQNPPLRDVPSTPPGPRQGLRGMSDERGALDFGVVRVRTEAVSSEVRGTSFDSPRASPGK